MVARHLLVADLRKSLQKSLYQLHSLSQSLEHDGVRLTVKIPKLSTVARHRHSDRRKRKSNESLTPGTRAIETNTSRKRNDNINLSNYSNMATLMH